MNKQNHFLDISLFDNILVSPLDWGLGHTTRCFPIIENLLHLGKKVFLACEPGSASEKILKDAFPQPEFLPLKGYHIHYSQTKKTFNYTIASQVPKVLAAIKNEHRQLQQWIDIYKIQLVISDNRYGLYSSKIPCIFITHQLRILASNRFLENNLQKINYAYINKFTECRVPDFESREINIAGKLSHPDIMPRVPVKYIGPLSRLQKLDTSANQYAFLILLSGPEPQRTILEGKLLSAISLRKEKTLFVRGLKNPLGKLTGPAGVTIIDYLDKKELSEMLAKSRFVIARSGYTTVMEMIVLQKKCIYIPTPGQTEQEYLADRLQAQKWAFCFEQDEADYNKKIDEALLFNYQLPDMKGADFSATS